jgi:hypothetical protein
VGTDIRVVLGTKLAGKLMHIFIAVPFSQSRPIWGKSN